MEESTDTFLNDTWILYFHDPDDEEWTGKSYKIQSTISSGEDWVGINISFSELWAKGMFFLMREHIQPLWEDPNNKKGGCFSYKVNKPDASYYWNLLGSKLLTDSLTKDELHIDKVCGISISPKRNYCILRIWISSSEYQSLSLYNMDIPSYTQIMYKSHQDNNDFEAKK